MKRIIVCLSGGLASAWCADWAFKNFDRKDIILYFNDTGWEHPDLYRFLDDVALRYLKKGIFFDSAHCTPEDIFFKERILGNNRVPLCSRKLKAERLQKFCRTGDLIVFGIGIEEQHRAERIKDVYARLAQKKRKPKMVQVCFPLIEEGVGKVEIENWVSSIGIKRPVLYDLGFKHNNCSGGCVRAGKKQWRLLLEKLQEVYAERERAEEKFRKYFNKNVSFLKDTTLKNLRIDIEQERLFKESVEENFLPGECVGICGSMS